MDVPQLDSFLAVVEAGSFTAAADRLHRSQPGVSRQIQRLEDELGVPLLNRNSGGVTPTEAGARFLIFARETVAQLRQLQADLKDVSESLTGRLRIAASTTPGQYLVPSLVGLFTGMHPQVEPSIAIMDSASVVSDVSQGAWDVGFVGVRKPDDTLSHHVFAHDEVVLAVPRNHRFAGHPSVSLEELEGERFLEREKGSGTREVVLEAFQGARRNLPPHKTAMVLSSTEAVASAVEQDQGIGWVSYRALEGRDMDRVAILRIRGRRLLRPLYLIHQPIERLREPVRSFVDWVRAEYPTRPE
ncbi:MAG TPA: LysR family transcriptional regulator, partial [Dehalococcoidia bacterium]|nr:LysR family transcriptional regulator [Dehalococcoidia bacterium]